MNELLLSIIYAIGLKFNWTNICWKLYWRYGSNIKSKGIEIYEKYFE